MLSAERFTELAHQLRVDDNFDSVVVSVGDGSGDNDAGLATVSAMGNATQVMMVNKYFLSFFEEISGEAEFVWESDKMAKYSSFFKKGERVKVTIDDSNVTIESFNSDGRRVERIVMPKKAKTAAANFVERGIPLTLEDHKDGVSTVKTRAKVQTSVRVKVESADMKKVAQRALTFNDYHFPVTFTKGTLNIQSGVTDSRVEDTYDRDINPISHEMLEKGRKKPVSVHLGDSFLAVIKVLKGDIVLDIGDSVPAWVSSYQVLKEEEDKAEDAEAVEEEGKKKKGKKGKKGKKKPKKVEEEPLYKVHYLVTPKAKKRVEDKKAKKSTKGKGRGKKEPEVKKEVEIDLDEDDDYDEEDEEDEEDEDEEEDDYDDEDD
jgi:hypothetical protein